MHAALRSDPKDRLGSAGRAAGQLSKPATWSQVKLANVGFGQGIAITPLQLASAFSVFADGVWRQPHIVKGYKKPESDVLVTPDKHVERQVVSPETARQMRNMLSAVIEHGTGRKARLDGYTAGGKTGTAQVAENGRYGGKFVSSFAGMAPLSNPQLVVVVAIRDPKGQHYGGEVAAPAFRQIAEESLLLLRAPRDRHDLAPANGSAEKVNSASFAE
ncbi:MAG: penicillin-binding transpeptidase domain-containing protein [Armatimonas sp.]